MLTSLRDRVVNLEELYSTEPSLLQKEKIFKELVVSRNTLKSMIEETIAHEKADRR